MHFKVLVFLISIKSYSLQQDISPIVDIKTLSELPLERLLLVKKTLHDDKNIENLQSKSDVPEALPLQSKSKPYDRGGHGSYHYDEGYSKKSGKKSIQSIFQISVTTLAFIAFGGYLLCLICQALAEKNMNNTTQIMTAALLRPIIRRRTTRRPQRYRRPTTRRPNGSARPRNKRNVDFWPEAADPENMYFALVQLSEAYTQYHTVDYRHYNYTKKFYT